MTSKELFEDILPLSPLQEGMLFHATYDEDALDVYTVRLAVDFEGPFDLDVFRESVRALLTRRSNLRAGFLSENLSKPVQVVPREFEPPVVTHDLSALTPEERDRRLAELATAEDAIRFELANPPLMRFTVVRLGERTWRLMFSCHHILIDGWSMPLVLGELFELYQRGGSAAGLPPAPPFKLFLAWLRKQDKEKGLAAWREALAGLAGPTLVAPKVDGHVAALPGQLTVDLPADRSAELAALARTLGITVNTMVQAAWALLVSRLTDREDVVFGATVSGRPPEIDGVEAIVGLFINTLPVRVRLDAAESVRALLLRVQDEQTALLDHHYIGLTDIQRAAGHGELFDNMVAFESYPVDAELLQGRLGDIAVTAVSGADATHYPLTLIGVPGERIQLRLGYRADLFDADTVAGLLDNLEWLLGAMADDAGGSVADLRGSITVPAGWVVPKAGSSVADFGSAIGGGRAPRTPHEELLCGLFAEVLGVPSVTIDDNFFDLGGHSLLATRLVSRVRSVFEIELPVRALFDTQTVVALAERVVGTTTGGRAGLTVQERPDRVPLSFAQRRLWFLNRMEGPSGTYNIPLAVKLSGALDVDALRAAFRDVVGRHEALRTTFPDVDGQPWQQFVPAAEVELSFTVSEVAADELPASLAEAGSVGFDLAAELPVRVHLFRVSADEHVVLVVVHHIASDGWSQAPLARDLGVAYQARTAGVAPEWTPLPVQYADYALWQRDVLGSEDDEDSAIAGQLTYWRNELAGVPDELALPIDRPRPPVSTYQGGAVSVELDARLHRNLLGLARSARASLFMVLQAGVSGLLSRLGAGTDIPLGTAIAGRTESALDDLVGFFVNTLVLRTDVSGDPGFRELVERARMTDLAAYAHQDLPFEQLVHAVAPSRSMARHPLFQVMIVLQNNAVAALDLPGVTARPVENGISAAKFDLGFNFIERKDDDGAAGGVEVTVEYSADLFDEATVARLSRRLVRLLSLAVADTTMPLSQLDILEADEWRQLVADRNVPVESTVDVAVDSDLDDRSARLARLLVDQGIRPGDVVAVTLPPSDELTVARHGVHRAGGVYLPVDPSDPAARTAAILADAKPALVLTSVEAPPGTGDLPVVTPEHPACLRYTVDPDGRPLGVVVPHRALAGQSAGRTYVLDAALNPMPTGSRGELYTGGPHLAHGYLGRPALTAQRFVADPFGPPGARLYRTGDLARITTAGELELLGRTDDQVTVGGRQVHLGEVEHALTTHPAVSHAVVIVHNGQELAAYYVATGEVDPRAHVTALLPEHLVPAHFVAIESVPVRRDGTVDRAALPEPQVATGRAPRTDVERTLCDLFAQLLGKPVTSIDDSFFELGGHSLLATRLVSKVRATFDIELPFRDIFDAQTVAALAERVTGSEDEGRTALCAQVRPERVPLSFAQRRLWFLNRMEGPSGTYNIPLAVRLSGALDVDALCMALVDVVGRHESLRTVFPEVDGEPWQRVLGLDELEVSFAVADVPAADLPAALAAAGAVGFDLSVDVPLRVRLFRVSADEHVLLVVVHHIAGDGWSQAPLARDLGIAYRARLAGEVPEWTPLPVQYADYALWQRDVLGSEDDEDSAIAGQLAFWREALAGVPDELALPADRPRPPVASYRGDSVSVPLDAQLHRDLVGLAHSTRASLFMVLQAGVAGLLSRLGAGKDVPLGTAIAGRTDSALDELVGFFVNTLVLRTDVSGDPGFRELVERARVADLAAYAHQDLPFEQLVHAVAPSRSMARHPLFQVMIVVQNNAVASLDLPGLVASPVDGGVTAAKFDLGFNFIERTDADGAPAGIDMSIEYSTDLFDAETVTGMAERLGRLLSAGVADTELPLSRFDVLGAGERHQLLVEWNDTAHPVPTDTIPGLFAAQVSRTPDRIALMYRDLEVTYADLDARSARLARLLAARGVRRGDVVAVAVPRSIELTVALLAVQRAGAAYLPVDLDYPAERVALMLADADPAVVVTTLAADVALPEVAAGIVVLDDVDTVRELATLPVEGGGVDGPVPDGPAYVIYTSGSTGRPKGVVVPHRGIVNRLLWMQATYWLGADDRVLQKTPSGFDVSVWEFFWPLVVGATQVVAKPGGHRDPAYLAGLIQDTGVTTAHFVPSMLDVFLAEPSAAACTGLRRVVCSGEALPQGLATRFRTLLDAELHNLYGPTEASVDVTAWDCATPSAAAVVPIGRPVWNTTTYVLDANLAPVPAGSSGELYLGGVQLAHGYLNRPDLTAQRFVADPFGPPGTRLYRTGDVARVTRDGVIEFLGRTDDQVKIRGQRVELGEIEHALVDHHAVRTAVVTVHTGPNGEPALVAYYTGAEVASAVLRDHLTTTLPDHMVPAHYVPLATIPVTPNGKLDRRALPAPRLDQRPAGREPRGEVEQALCEIFAELLGHEMVGIDDNFFELGGHSLLATKLVSRVRARLGVEMSIVLIFEAPTVAALASRLDGGGSAGSLDVLVPLRPGGVAAPVFCVHPLGGLSWPYVGLAEHLPPEVGLYGLQAVGLTGEEPLPATLEEMAAGYVAAIRTVQADGPYRLLGWSLGGQLAHAMAELLEADGATVELLALLDSYPRTATDEDATFSEPEFLQGILVAADLDPAEVDGPLDFDRVMRAVRSAGKELAGLSDEQVRGLQRVMANSVRAEAGSVTGHCRADTVMFAATVDPVGDPADWRGHLAGEFEIHGVAARHADLMRPRPLAEIGAVLAKKLADTADGERE